MTTLAPPAVVPVVVPRPLTAGAGVLRYVKWSALTALDVPLPVVTSMSTVPAEPAGATAVIDVSELMVYEVAAVEPNRTAVAPVKPVPVMVTEAPPLVFHWLGLTPV